MLRKTEIIFIIENNLFIIIGIKSKKPKKLNTSHKITQWNNEMLHIAKLLSKYCNIKIKNWNYRKIEKITNFTKSRKKNSNKKNFQQRKEKEKKHQKSRNLYIETNKLQKSEQKNEKIKIRKNVNLPIFLPWSIVSSNPCNVDYETVPEPFAYFFFK